MVGIVSYGTYLPYHRLDRASIGAALGTPPGRGTRAVASYDEDATSMAVEAARAALRPGAGEPPAPRQVLLATTSPPYLDKTNAAAVHAALRLDPSAGAYDLVGSVRSGVAALVAARDAAAAGRPSLAVLSDVRVGLPGGADEQQGGDGAAAFVLGDDGVIAEVVAHGVATVELLDRWRVPGEPASRAWEERFGEGAYVAAADQAIADALKQAGVTPGDVDRLVVAGVHARAAGRVRASAGVRPESVVDDLAGTVGNTGAAHPGLLLAAALDVASPGEVVVVVILADGADCLVLRTTDRIAGFTPRRTVASQLAGAPVGYQTYLTWRELLVREPPRRPDPEKPAAPPSFRRAAWKFGLEASRCESCGTRHLPPVRVCVSCGAVDEMASEPMADVEGVVATSTIDRLAFSLSPPVVAAVIDFAGGGRLQCEMTDVDPAAVRIGDRVEMTFRRLFTADGVHNYFWKARPVRGEGSGA